MDWRLWQTAAVLSVLCHSCWGDKNATLPPVHIRYHDHLNSTSGESGMPCTKIGRRCLTNITCENKRCVCPEGSKGSGLMECVTTDHLLCMVTADPHLDTYGNSHASIDLPCRYRLTRFVTDHRTKETPHALCSVEIYAINELNLGFYYVSGVHISVGLTDSGRQVHHQFEVRQFGINEDSMHDYYTNITHTRTLWGYSKHENVKGVELIPTFDHENNFAVLEVPECDIRVKYRAYDRQKHRQHLVPGISIMAPNDTKFVDQYGSNPFSLCGTDNDNHTLLPARASHLGLPSADLAVIYDILNEAPPQIDNPMRGACEAAFAVFNKTQNKVADLNYCGQILTSTSTRKCIQKASNSHKPIHVFIACLRFRQNGELADCNLVADIHNSCKKKWKGPRLACNP